MEVFVDIVLMAFLVVIAAAVLLSRNLVVVVMLGSLYSLVMAAIWVLLDAVDVAFTEAAVGAGITTVLMLAALALTGAREKRPAHRFVLPLAVVLLTGAALVYGTFDVPPFGAPDNPVHQHVVPYYLRNSLSDTLVPNVVTSVLASYRGYDTLGETTVIFTAGIGVMLLIGRVPVLFGRRRKP